MAEKGSILTKNLDSKERTYAAMPLVLGMHEMQLPRLSPEYLQNLEKYFNEGFGLEYIATAVPQTRIIPIEESVTPEHSVATYEEVRKIIDKADPILVGECICRKAAEMTGSPCSVSHRKEVCMGLNDFGAAYSQFIGFGRKVTKEEALDILRQNEEDGLVLQTSNQQEPYFICSCCGDCCGLLKAAKNLPRSVDFFSSNYFSQVDSELCTGCGKCVSRCQMEAIQLKNEKAVIDKKRCIGCGVCVAACPRGAHSLVKKKKKTVPPKTEEAYFDVLATKKKKNLQKLATGMRAKLGIPR
jgi:Na+-translocating ferredoxin:NAD+ oxidoreductase RNF subunit RnfB